VAPLTGECHQRGEEKQVNWTVKIQPQELMLRTKERNDNDRKSGVPQEYEDSSATDTESRKLRWQYFDADANEEMSQEGLRTTEKQREPSRREQDQTHTKQHVEPHWKPHNE